MTFLLKTTIFASLLCAAPAFADDVYVTDPNTGETYYGETDDHEYPQDGDSVYVTNPNTGETYYGEVDGGDGDVYVTNPSTGETYEGEIDN